jgi:hypothetical protein
VRSLPLRWQHYRHQIVSAYERHASRPRSLHQGLRPIQHERERRVIAVGHHAVVATGARVTRADFREGKGAHKAHDATDDPGDVEEGRALRRGRNDCRCTKDADADD